MKTIEPHYAKMQRPTLKLWDTINTELKQALKNSTGVITNTKMIH